MYIYRDLDLFKNISVSKKFILYSIIILLFFNTIKFLFNYVHLLSNLNVVLLIWSFILFSVVYKYPGTGFNILLVTMFFPYRIVDSLFYLNVSKIQDIPYFLLIIMVMRAMTKNKNNIKLFIRSIPMSIKGSIFFIFLISTISSYINNVNIIDFIFYFRWLFFLFGLMFVISTRELPITKAYRLVVIIGLLQIPIVFFQRFILVAFLGISMGDIVRGVFPTYYELIFYQIACILIMVTFKVRKLKLFNSFSSTTIILLLLSSLVFTNSKSAWIYLIFSGILLIKKIKITKAQKTKIMLSSFVIVLFAIFSFNYILNSKRLNRDVNSIQQYAAYLWNPRYIYQYFFLFNSFARVQDLASSKKYDSYLINHLGRGGEIAFNYLKISKSMPNLFFGLGPPPALISEKHFAKSDRFHLIGGPVYVRVLGDYGISGIMSILIFTFMFYKWRIKPNVNDIDNLVLRKSIIFLVFLLMIYYGVWFSIYTAFVLSMLFCSGFYIYQRTPVI